VHAGAKKSGQTRKPRQGAVSQNSAVLSNGRTSKARTTFPTTSQATSRRRGRRNSRRARIRTYSSRASAHRSNCFGIP
jgi:hypothetical protein